MALVSFMGNAQTEIEYWNEFVKIGETYYDFTDNPPTIQKLNVNNPDRGSHVRLYDITHDSYRFDPVPSTDYEFDIEGFGDLDIGARFVGTLDIYWRTFTVTFGDWDLDLWGHPDLRWDTIETEGLDPLSVSYQGKRSFDSMRTAIRLVNASPLRDEFDLATSRLTRFTVTNTSFSRCEWPICQGRSQYFRRVSSNQWVEEQYIILSLVADEDTYVHEIAHAHHSLVIPGGFQNEQWVGEYNDMIAANLRTGGPNFTPSYWRTNTHEFYAECVTLYFGTLQPNNGLGGEFDWRRRVSPQEYEYFTTNLLPLMRQIFEQ